MTITFAVIISFLLLSNINIPQSNIFIIYYYFLIITLVILKCIYFSLYKKFKPSTNLMLPDYVLLTKFFIES